jgi:hypothetical protein
VLLLAQVFGPGIAASAIRSRLSPYGRVDRVEVKATPAIELLWGEADSVTVNAPRLSLTPARTVSLLAEARATSHVDATVASLALGPLRLQHAHLVKSGSELTGEAMLPATAAAAALPRGTRVGLISSDAGHVRVAVSGSLFGVGATVQAVAEANAGALIAHPAAFPFSSFRLTLFSDPRLAVEAVGASVASRAPLTYRLTMAARLR